MNRAIGSLFLSLLLWTMIHVVSFLQITHAYHSTTLVALVVGDGAACPSSSVSCTTATPLHVLEFNSTNGTLINTPRSLNGIALSGTDYHLGTLHRCTDGTCIIFTGIDTTIGTNPGLTFPYFPNADRIIGRLDHTTTINLSTRIPSSMYEGIPKGACSMDGSRYWIVGNTTNQTIITVPNGQGNLPIVLYGMNNTNDGIAVSCYVRNTQPCFTTLVNRRNNVVAIRVIKQDASTLTTSFTNMSDVRQYSDALGAVSKQLIMNSAQNKFWVADTRAPRIWYGTTLATMSVITSTLGAVAIALSHDETKLLFVTRYRLYSYAPADSLSGTLVLLNTLPFSSMTGSSLYYEFRGLAMAPLGCLPGERGYYCPNGNPPLIPCGSGTYNPLPGASTCSKCTAGTYNPNIGQSFCLPCPNNTYSFDGASSCMNKCPAGSYFDNRACYVCPLGSYSMNSGSRFCTLASPGTFVNRTNATAFALCPIGTELPFEGGTSLDNCSLCGLGNYSMNEGSANCLGCNPGTYADTFGSSNCLFCPKGTYSATEGAISNETCLECPFGTLSIAGQSKCYVCPSGTYAYRTYDSDCSRPCPAGWYCDGISPPQPCPGGTYSKYTGMTRIYHCYPCDPGTFSTQNSSFCTPCPDGTYAEFSNTNSSDGCLACIAGTYTVSNGSTTCIPCKFGTYSTLSKANSSQTCVNCPSGTASSVVGADNEGYCTICGPGKYSSEGYSNCTNCEAGTFSNSSGSSTCTRCSEGQHSLPGSTECVNVKIIADHLRSSTDGRGGMVLPFQGPGVGTGDGRGFIGAVALDVPVNYVPFGLDSNGTMYLALLGDTPSTFNTGSVYQIKVNGSMYRGKQSTTTIAGAQLRIPPVSIVSTSFAGSIALGPDGRSFVTVEEYHYSENYYCSITNNGNRNRKRILFRQWPSINETGIDMHHIIPSLNGLVSCSYNSEHTLVALGVISAPIKGITVIPLRKTDSSNYHLCNDQYQPVSYPNFFTAIVEIANRTGYSIDGAVVAIRNDGMLAVITERHDTWQYCPYDPYCGYPYGNSWTYYASYRCYIDLYDPVLQRRTNIFAHAGTLRTYTPCTGNIFITAGFCLSNLDATFDSIGNLNLTQTGEVTSALPWKKMNITLNTSAIGINGTTYIADPLPFVGPGKFIFPIPPSYTINVSYIETMGTGIVLGKDSMTSSTVWSYNLLSCVTDMNCPSPCTFQGSQCTHPLGANSFANLLDMLVANDSTVYILAKGATGSAIFTFNGNTGELLWTYKGPTSDRQPIGMMLAPDGTLYVTGGGLYAVIPCPLGMSCDEFVTGNVCDAGYYASEYGQARCLPCKSGSYNRMRGQTQCTECPVGTFSTENAATSRSSCIQCDSGYYSNRTGANTPEACRPCPRGTYSTVFGAGSHTVCMRCATGFYGPNEGASSCEPCEKGTYGSIAGSATANETCIDCPAGSYNDLEGQTRLGCTLCPKGYASSMTKATSRSTCQPCSAGSAAVNEGSSQCVECGAGSYSDTDGAEMCTLCPKNTYNPDTGSRSSSACRRCPGSTSTAVTGSTSLDDCVPIAFTCPAGMQSKSTVSTPTSIADCVPLACIPPLQPVTSTGTLVNTNASGTYCGGCPPSTYGIPGSCSSPCSIDNGEYRAICPGFLSIGLPTAKALSLFSQGYNGTWICNGGSIKLTEVSMLDQTIPTVSIDSSTASIQETMNQNINGVVAGGSMIVILTLIALVFILRQKGIIKKTGKSVFTSSPTKGSPSHYHQHPLVLLATRYMTLGLETLDAFALQHNLKRGQPVTREPTPLGGMCSIAGYSTLIVLSIILIIRRDADNELIQQSLSILDENVLLMTATMPWITSNRAALPNVPETDGSIRFRVITAGDYNKPCRIKNWISSGITKGQFQYSVDYTDQSCYRIAPVKDNHHNTNEPYISQHSWGCKDCLLSSHSSLTFTVPVTCQSMILEALSVAADGSVTVLSAGTNEGQDSSTEIERVANEGPITKIVWSVLPLLIARKDERTGIATRGYNLIDSGILINRLYPNVLVSEGNTSLVSENTTIIPTVNTVATVPSSDSVTVTVSMNLQPFYTLTIISEKTSVIQLFANIAGLMGIFSIFGILFRTVEEKMIGLPNENHASPATNAQRTKKFKGEEETETMRSEETSVGSYYPERSGVTSSSSRNGSSVLSYLHKRVKNGSGNSSTVPLSTNLPLPPYPSVYGGSRDIDAINHYHTTPLPLPNNGGGINKIGFAPAQALGNHINPHHHGTTTTVYSSTGINSSSGSLQQRYIAPKQINNPLSSSAPLTTTTTNVITFNETNSNYSSAGGTTSSITIITNPLVEPSLLVSTDNPISTASTTDTPVPEFVAPGSSYPSVVPSSSALNRVPQDTQDNIWLKHEDEEGDVWYTKPDGTDSVWEPPQGAIIRLAHEWYQENNYD